MLNLQLGIRFSVGGVEARREAPTLAPQDFTVAVRYTSPLSCPPPPSPPTLPPEPAPDRYVRDRLCRRAIN